jgi:hypothetical protein
VPAAPPGPLARLLAVRAGRLPQVPAQPNTTLPAGGDAGAGPRWIGWVHYRTWFVCVSPECSSAPATTRHRPSNISTGEPAARTSRPTATKQPSRPKTKPGAPDAVDGVRTHMSSRPAGWSPRGRLPRRLNRQRRCNRGTKANDLRPVVPSSPSCPLAASLRRRGEPALRPAACPTRARVRCRARPATARGRRRRSGPGGLARSGRRSPGRTGRSPCRDVTDGMEANSGVLDLTSMPSNTKEGSLRR